MKRPIIIICFMQIISIVTAAWLDNLIAAILFIIFLSTLLFVFSGINKKTLILCFLISVFACTTYLSMYTNADKKLNNIYDKFVEIKGVVSSQPITENQYQTFVLKTDKIIIDEEEINLNLKLNVSISGSNVSYGKTISFNGYINKVKKDTNPNCFNYKEYLLQKGIYASVYGENDNLKIYDESGGNIVFKAAINVREYVSNCIMKYMPEQNGAIVCGMLTGDKTYISEATETMFSSTGLSHTMAVSGSHVAYILLPLMFLAKKTGVNRKAAYISIIFLLMFFSFISGLTPSVIRAVIMAIVVLLGKILYKDTDFYISIAFSCVLQLLLNPYNLFNPGFLLSYFAAVSIVMLTPIINEKLERIKIPRIIAQASSVCIAAQIGTIPITAFFFHSISLSSLAANLLIAPARLFIAMFGWIIVFIDLVMPSITFLFIFLCNIPAGYILFIANIFYSIPGLLIFVTSPTLFSFISYYLFTIYFLYFKNKYKSICLKKWDRMIIIITIFALIFSYINLPNPRIVFIDVGQGDGALIITETNKKVLIDGGPDEKVLEYLLSNQIKKLDIVMVTHGHDDHIQGIYDVVEHIKTKYILLPQNDNCDEIKKLIDIAKEKNIEVIRVYKGMEIQIDNDTKMEIIWPEKNLSMDENNMSIVAKVYTKNYSVLFTGDIEKEAEEKIVMNKSNIDVDILKVAHHGSDTSSLDEFVKKASPQIAVISVGVNKFGHPSEITLNTLKAYDIFTLRTDIYGAITISFLKDKYKISTMS